MFARLLLLLILLPLVELSILVWIADRTSLAFTIGLVIVTGLIGVALVRFQGVWTLWRMREQVARGEVPADAMLDGILVLIAGVLLLTPGVVTDLAAILLLFPPTRTLVKRQAIKRIQARVTAHFSRMQDAWQAPPSHDRIIDVRVVEPPGDDRRLEP